MQREDLIEFSSYDRLFPSQDFIEKDGFGNLIALPFQDEPRKLDNSVFVDLNFRPFEDQWEYLYSVGKVNTTLMEYEIEKNKAFDEVIKINEPKGLVDESDEVNFYYWQKRS